jgi:hypothetical protein
MTIVCRSPGDPAQTAPVEADRERGDSDALAAIALFASTVNEGLEDDRAMEPGQEYAAGETDAASSATPVTARASRLMRVIVVPPNRSFAFRAVNDGAPKGADR